MSACWCFTCMRSFHSLGIARHRAMHRDKKEDCKIKFSGGDIYEYAYSKPRSKINQIEGGK